MPPTSPQGASQLALEQATQETEVRSLRQEDPLEEDMAAHSSILAWRIPSTEQPGELQSVESQRVGHDQVTENAHTHTISKKVGYAFPLPREAKRTSSGFPDS